jgi:hypothetical protein
MATTTNYGWTTPDDTALVKDGAAAIRTLGSSVDTTTKNLNPSTTLGDIEYRSSTANVNTRLPLGTAGQVLKVNSGATAPEWATDASGMTNPMTTTGDTIYSSSGSTPARLGIGSTGNVLTVAGGVPTWSAPSSGALTKIVSTTFSAVSTQDFLSCFTSTYRTYKIVFSNIKGSANADMQLKLYTSTSTLLDDYSGGVMQISTAGTPTAAFNNSYLTVFSFGKIGSSAGTQYSGGEITLFQGSELVGGYGATSGITSWQSGGGVSFRIGYYGSLNIDGNDAITGFQLLPSTGTISGTATVYGLEK